MRLPTSLLLVLMLVSVLPGRTQDTAEEARDLKGPPPPKGGLTNSLGMRFLPVPGTKVMFSIWETRVQDYRTYAEANAGVNTDWKDPHFSQDDTYPVVNISWDDGNAFCAWLTKQERQAGRLSDSQSYRLPTDAEWSRAVGLEMETGGTPKKKDRRIQTSPWGTQWPPPEKAGNFADSYRRERRPDWNGSVINSYYDGWVDTSPVGTFPPNQFGLYDIAGNVAEWCEDWYDAKQESRVCRGSSFGSGDRLELWSSSRAALRPTNRNRYTGFRCVLAASP